MNNTDYGNALIFIDKAISFYTEAIHKPLLSIKFALAKDRIFLAEEINNIRRGLNHAYYTKGIAHEKLDQPDKAIKAYTAGIEARIY